jgi:hypothetical protein
MFSAWESQLSFFRRCMRKNSNLVDIVGQQSKAYLAKRKKR